MEKPSAISEISMPIFFGTSWSALRTRQRAYRYMPATTTTIRIAPAANQRRSRETGRGISLKFSGWRDREGGSCVEFQKSDCESRIAEQTAKVSLLQSD